MAILQRINLKKDDNDEKENLNKYNSEQEKSEEGQFRTGKI